MKNKGRMYEERFAVDVPLFGGLYNGNYRMRVCFRERTKNSGNSLIEVDGKMVKIVSLENKDALNANRLTI